MKGTSFISLIICTAALVGCSGDSSKTDNPSGGGTTGSADGGAKLKDLKVEDVKVGTGAGAEDGDTVSVLYRGTFLNGQEFDGNMDPEGKPREGKEVYPVMVGMGGVIKGWDKGLVGIKTGGERKLSVPAALAYGPNASGKVPPNTDLYFTIKCLDVIKKGEERVMDHTDLKPGAGAPVKKGDTVTIHYVGKLLTGKEFDSSREKKKPFTFEVGKGDAIACIEVGVVGMKKGGLRRLRVPPMAALGAMPTGGIPGGSVLIFEIEVLDVKHK